MLKEWDLTSDKMIKPREIMMLKEWDLIPWWAPRACPQMPSAPFARGFWQSPPTKGTRSRWSKSRTSALVKPQGQDIEDSEGKRKELDLVKLFHQQRIRWAPCGAVGQYSSVVFWRGVISARLLRQVRIHLVDSRAFARKRALLRKCMYTDMCIVCTSTVLSLMTWEDWI